MSTPMPTAAMPPNTSHYLCPMSCALCTPAGLPGASVSAQAVGETVRPIAITKLQSLCMWWIPRCAVFELGGNLPWQRCQNKRESLTICHLLQVRTRKRKGRHPLAPFLSQNPCPRERAEGVGSYFL